MLKPEEIQAREFLVSLRGYDREEVHSFLEKVATQVRDLQRQVEILQAGQAAAPSAEVAAEPVAPSAATVDTMALFAEIGQETQRILEAAHEAGSEIQRKARNEADRALAEARDHAAKLVAEGQRRREVIEGVVKMLEERRGALAIELRGVVRTVEQVLTDLAPRGGEVPTPDELLAVAQITAPDESWVPPDDGHELAFLDVAAAVDEPDDDATVAAEPAARKADATLNGVIASGADEAASSHGAFEIADDEVSPHGDTPADQNRPTKQAGRTLRIS